MPIDKAKPKRRPTKTPAAAGRARIVEESCKAVKRVYDLPEGPMPKPKPGKLGAEKLMPEEQNRPARP